ncbi:MAG: type II toxin-antitoxin system PemK/MazF family toxin [Ilumatobacter sp.]
MLRSGDIVRVDFGFPRGSKPGFERPAVVVTSDDVMEHRPRTMHVVALTTNTQRRLPTGVPIDDVDGLPYTSVAQCHLLQVISVEDLVDGDNAIGHVGPMALAQIRSIIGDLLEIG